MFLIILSVYASLCRWIRALLNYCFCNHIISYLMEEDALITRAAVHYDEQKQPFQFCVFSDPGSDVLRLCASYRRIQC